MVSLPENLRPKVGVARSAYEAWCAGFDQDDPFALDDEEELASKFVRAIRSLRGVALGSGVDSEALEESITAAFPLAVEAGFLELPDSLPSDDEISSFSVQEADSEDARPSAQRAIQTQEDLDKAYPLNAGEEFLIHRFPRPFGPSQVRVCECGLVWLRAAEGLLSYDLVPYRSIVAFEYQELGDGRRSDIYLNIRTGYGSVQMTGTTEELTAIVEAVSARLP